MELPFHLKTLQPLPGALNILRYFKEIDGDTADADDIMDDLDLSQRAFSKAVRRLVTKGYMTMDGDFIYRLTEQGQGAIVELAEYDAATGSGLGGVAKGVTSPVPEAEPQYIARRVVLAVPGQLVAERETEVLVGFHPGEMPEAAEIAVRLSLVNGQPETPDDTVFALDDSAAYQTMTITPGLYDAVRIKLQVIQLGPNPGDFNQSGGMYVDVPVVADGANTRLTAYGADVNIMIESQ